MNVQSIYSLKILSSATQKMTEIQVFKSCTENPISSSSSIRVIDLVKDFEERSSIGQCNHSSDYKDEDEFDDSVVLCVSGSRLVRSGFTKIGCTENILRFINAGGEAIREVGDSSINIMPDDAFDGGDVFRTNESIIDGGDFASFYQSARVGNICYQFENLWTGEYIVDLHFAEIVNTNGPKGMRVFDVFVQEEKVVSDLDIYAIVGANRPLQIVGVKFTVGESNRMLIRFEGVHGSPLISGICIKEAPKLPGDLNKLSRMKEECPFCHSSTAQMELTTSQSKLLRRKSTSKYEKKIEELNNQFQLKTDECYQAWMSLSALNKELEKVQMELDNKSFQNHCLDQAMVLQAAKLRDVSNKYECDKNSWAAAIDELGRKIKIMKQEHFQLSREAHDCANSIPDLHEMVSAVQGLVAQCEDLKLKYIEEHVKRKKLYNQIQEARGNIRVFCRCRPLSKEEVSSGCVTVVDFDAAKDGDLGIHNGSSSKKIYKFDCVYTPRDNQVDVFADASPMVVSVLDGYNVCIFAYGQTGTGKTFTMEGTEQNRGVNYRTLEHLFKVVEERKETFTYHISVSVLEVYNEQIRDLLATSPTSKKLEVRQASEGVHHVPGIVEAKVENVKEVWNVLQAGSNARAVGSNNVNEHSSRSHCMICIMVRGKNMMHGESTKSKLWLVDLAGSERLAKTDVQGERLKEAQNINRSLSALGDVISALATKSSHIPYRNSKLTHLLQDSLGGDSKTLMFAQISPSELDMGETISSLNFATRVRGVELGPAKKQIDSGELQKLKVLLDKAKQESRSKDEALRKLEENYQNLECKSKNKDHFSRNQQEKVTELEVKLESRTEFCKQFEKQLMQRSDQLKEKEEICMTLQHKVNELENKLKEHELVQSKILQHKVMNLESELKERTQAFELQSVTFQEKIKELENKLESERDIKGYLLLQQKIEELEKKLRTKDDLTVYTEPSCSSEKQKRTPNERKAYSTAETPSGIDNRRLRSLNSISRPSSQGSVLLKGPDSIRELRRKQDLQSKGIENNFLLSAPSVEKKVLPTDSSKARRLDPSKAFARITRSRQAVSSAQRPLTSNRINREQVMGVKEGDNGTRVWSR